MISGKEYTRRITNPLARRNAAAVYSIKIETLLYRAGVVAPTWNSIPQQMLLIEDWRFTTWSIFWRWWRWRWRHQRRFLNGLCSGFWALLGRWRGSEGLDGLGNQGGVSEPLHPRPNVHVGGHHRHRQSVVSRHGRVCQKRSPLVNRQSLLANYNPFYSRSGLEIATDSDFSLSCFKV